MATTTCGKCENTTFEMKEIEPKDSSYKFGVIQCASCGTPVSTLALAYISERIEEIEKKIDSMGERLANS
ncbi:MAG: hypothetical protein ABUK01_07835 [Leptospirales bacterium]